MSSSLFASTSFNLPFRVSQTSVRYAGRVQGGADPVKEILRRALYPPNIRNKPTPTGTWRPDVSRALQRAIPSKQAHDTIERAWLLHMRHLRRKREVELGRKYECMRRAMDVLETIDAHLYSEANRQVDPRARSPAEVELAKTLKGMERKALESRPPGLFPRELRAPTDTPSRAGWKYDWKPVIPSL
ncbi:hypothetical protein EW146_g1526 [Bondarzewia mesenterica]|uniref:54S ribosomal protein L28, mitochondrial n=1 Tax=Bondarzewia mesenterica TaxID=1095465 RepID=A0A4S4M5D4_9AGAM|nr:hypothetical protein EW146_g1526 [Bondarzewia mesenterica]